MNQKKLGIAITLILFIAIINSICSQEKSYARDQLNLALKDYQIKYENLMIDRGFGDIDQKIGDNYISKLLKAYGDRSFEYEENLGILYYHVSENKLQTWLINASGILSFNENNISKRELTNLNNRLRSTINVDQTRGASSLNDNINDGLNSITAEVTLVLLPVEIPGHLNKINHLIIIPEYNIGQFPFYILRPYDDEKYLIDILSISIAPTMMDQQNFDEFFSIEYLCEPLNFNFEKPLVVGNPVFVEDANFHFQDLPGAEEEANFVASISGCEALTGFKANISTIQDKAKDSDFMYFATHAMADFRNPLDSSFIVLTSDESDSLGFWTAREIQYADISAEMVVLSACQTGLGKSHEGGVIGLSRAFFIAGVDHTIMSLWSVSDEATKNLMQRFIRNLQNPEANMGYPMVYYPSEHLRQAILEYKKLDPDPAHWAPFVLFGYPF